MIYEVGDKVRVIHQFNVDGDSGKWGELVEARPNNNWRVKVYFSNDEWDIFTLHESEIGAFATEPTAAAQGEVVDAKVIATGLTAFRREGGSITVYREHPGMHEVFVDTLDYTAKIAALEAALQQAQRERDAAVAALEPFSELYRDWLANRHEIEFFDYLNRYRVSDELLADVMNASVAIQTASAQQAAQPADGEG